ncbi:MAG: hypothetical protein C4289_00555 [Chloroflexota bacterium]
MFGHSRSIHAQPQLDDFPPDEAEKIARTAAVRGWEFAAHEYMRALSHHAYRHAVDEYRAHNRFLLPLEGVGRVLCLRCGWGAVAFNLAGCLPAVLALDDRPAHLHFMAARRRQSGVETLHLVRACLSAPLPFATGSFEAAIIQDTPEIWQPAATWKNNRYASHLLAELHRVVRDAGWLLISAPNRLGIVRSRREIQSSSQTLWRYRSLLHEAGFADVGFYAPLPSDAEPFFIVPLQSRWILEFFMDRILQAEDYRTKLQVRGLSGVFRIVWALWQLSRWLRLTGLARYVVPAYLITARKQV